ncbi:helicase-exonuclease AddAB subunit AddB [Clostridium sp. AM58-1XD]|uniref:helicase-exonuclease AddAB subunit AddB n=1 Tax=Clostridium sp. AM58-1XD TaxID=2292307 RepID=UPI000E5047CC|nr:helicase-exonuclease AddAB subunit AddB [Clostridium sp. AM58-1XD]RGY95646.1 helicase-exonuclease AddAB subunit AddB [Clostridium sp. AM58-1XD]
MSIQFVLGGSGSGKTRFLYDNLISESMDSPEKRFILLVPEQFTMQTQREIVNLHPYHGTMNIDIVSFGRLAYRVFEELAIENPVVLDDMGKSMVLRKVAAGEKKRLGIFRGHLSHAGFIGQMKSMISEMAQYGISYEMLDEMIPKVKSPLLGEKLKDLSIIYKGFRDYISDKFITSEEILDVLCRVFPDSDRMRDSEVILDGFTGFTPVQYRVLEQMMRCCRRVRFAVTVEPSASPFKEGGMHNLFHMSKHTACRLTAAAKKNGVEKEQDIVLNERPYPRFSKTGESRSALDFLEENLYRYGRKSYKGEPEEIRLYKALNPSEEVGLIIHQIERTVRDEKLRYRDIAVVTGSLENYGNEISRQFEAAGIPYFMDDKKNIMSHPLVELIRSALETVRQDFSYESVFRYLKCGMIMDERSEERDRLENYVLALGIRGFKRWDSRWEQVYRGAANLNLEALNCFKEEILAPLKVLRQFLKEKEATVEQMTGALADYLFNCEIEQKVKEYEEKFEAAGEYRLAREYGQVYGLVIEMLDRVVALLGKERISLKEYGEILDAGFEEIRVGIIPATIDRIVVGDLTRTRLDHVKVLFFAGVNDGIVPARKDGGGILSDMEKDSLKEFDIELAPTAREEGFLQRFYLYLMMTKPSDRLILSFSGMDAEGKGLRPSSLIHELKGLFPRLTIQDGSRDQYDVISMEEGRRTLIESLREFETVKGEARFLELYRFFFLSERHRKQVENLVEAAFYSYKEKGIGKAAAREIYGRILSGSVTRLEQYEACAYAHFLTYGLELSERQEYELGAVDFGNLFHGAIDLCFSKAREEGKRIQDLNADERKRLVKLSVNEVADQYGGAILKSTARNEYLTERAERITERTVWALSEQLKKGDFEPAGFEVSFSAIDNLKAMRISLSEEEELQLRGRIDRLDLCEDQKHVYVKIIDYKSGSTSFDLAALYYGLQLQLVVYMDAAMEMEERKNPEKEIVPAGIFYYHINDPVIESTGETDKEEIDREILRQLKMNGLVNSEQEVIALLDREIEKASDVIPVAMKDGMIQEAKSSVANRRRFEALRVFVRDKLKTAGTKIMEGDISVRPYKQGTRSACDYCPYHAVCGFDRKVSGYSYRKFGSIKAEEVWNAIEGGNHGNEVD